MKMVLEASVFGMQGRDVDLLTLFRAGTTARFRIVVSHAALKQYEAWLLRQSPHLSEYCREVLELAILSEATEPSSVRLAVVADLPAGADQSSSVTLNDALRICRTPFAIVVENAVNDRKFLLAVASPEARSRLFALEREASIEFKNGGGIGTMRQTLEHDLGSQPDLHFRSWVLFDSDAASPGIPSNDSELVRELCVKYRVPFHQLRRRSIENYIPPNALRTWVFATPKRRHKVPLFRAFCGLSDVQKHHYHLKRGFQGQAPAGGLYSSLSPDDRRSLDSGFGNAIAEETLTFDIHHSEFTAYGVTAEMDGVLASLISLIC